MSTRARFREAAACGGGWSALAGSSRMVLPFRSAAANDSTLLTGRHECRNRHADAQLCPASATSCMCCELQRIEAQPRSRNQPAPASLVARATACRSATTASCRESRASAARPSACQALALSGSASTACRAAAYVLPATPLLVPSSLSKTYGLRALSTWVPDATFACLLAVLHLSTSQGRRPPSLGCL